MQPQSPASPVSPAVSQNINNSDMIPSQWPGAIFGAYKYSKEIVKMNLGTIVLLILINILISIVLSIISNIDTGSAKPAVSFVTNLASYVASSFIEIAIIFAFLASVKKSRIQVGEAINLAVPKILNAFLYTVITGFILVASLIALVIPVFFVAPRLTFGYYLIAEKDMNALEALKASWAMSKGNIGKVYGLFFAMIIMALPVITVIGVIFTIYFLFMYQAGYFLLYKFIENQKNGAQNPAGSPAMPQSPANPNPVAPAPAQPVIPPTTPQTMVPSGPSPDAQSAPQAEAPAPPTENTTTTPPQA